jgi:hypothetical protein
MLLRTIYFLCLLSIGLTTSGFAASTGLADRSRYFPLDHPAYDYISRLHECGLMLKLSPSVRPYTRSQVNDVVEWEQKKSHGKVIDGWLDWLHRECAKELKTLSDTVRVNVTARFETTESLRSLRPDRENFFGGIGFGGAMGKVVFDVRFAHAQHLMTTSGEADHRDPKVIAPDEEGLIRPMEGYVKADFPVFGGRCSAEVLLGRIGRNWSPAGTSSLILGKSAQSFDQLALQFRSAHLTFTHLVAALDPVDYFPGGSSTTIRARRFFSAHRLDYRIWDNFRIGLSETTVYGGVGRTWDLALMNPLTSYRLLATQDSERWNNNSFVAADCSASLGGLVNLRGQMLFDDFLLEDEIQDRWALNLGADICRLPLPGANTLRLEYERVSSFAYNTFQSWERYLVSGRPLGAELGNDYRRVTVALTQYFTPDFDITGRVSYTGRGAHRVTSPISGLLNSASLRFPTKTVEESLEVMLSLRWQALGWCNIKASGGLLDQSGLNNVAGSNRQRGFATVVLCLYHDLLMKF